MLKSQAQRTGILPESLRRRPRLLPWLAKFYEAFGVLSQCRQVGMGGAGPIPLTEIMAYFELYDIEREERPVWLRMIKGLDAAYLDHHLQRRQSSTPKADSYRPPVRQPPPMRRRR